MSAAGVEPTVFVVDDDDAVRHSVCVLLRSVGLAAEPFDSAAALLAAMPPAGPACLVLDIRMPRMSGLELQRTLAERRIELPIIFITGHGDVPMAVQAMKNGAVDFIEKPFNDQVLIDRVQQALALAEQRRASAEELSEVRARLVRLTAREREVFNRIVRGQANKVIAIDLGLSERTVEIHRAHVMEKTGAGSVADLVRMALVESGQSPA
ncbi:MAG: response regulator transcription factor [Gammaproteobacteria bacterium]